MKKILHFSIFLISLVAFAQPSISSSDFDNLNVSYAIKNAISTTLTEGAVGAGVTWDFSSLVLSYDPQDGIETVIQVPNGPFSSNFPNANYVLKSFSSSSGSEDFYSYFNKTPTILEELASSSSSAVNYSYINPYTTFIFPLTYGSISTDSSQETGQNLVYTETKTYDAYGTLITPFGTFNNVIRIKTVQNDSTDFEWYGTSPFKPLLNVFQTFNGEREFTFYEPSTLTTESFNQKSLYVFTSSLNNNLNIVTDNSLQINHLNIIDLTGKTILQRFGNVNSINIEVLSSGIYFVQVDSNKGIFTQKFVKK